MQTTHQALDKKEAFLSQNKKKTQTHAAADEIIGKTSSFTIGARKRWIEKISYKLQNPNMRNRNGDEKGIEILLSNQREAVPNERKERVLKICHLPRWEKKRHCCVLFDRVFIWRREWVKGYQSVAH